MDDARKDPHPETLGRQEFMIRFHNRFKDPYFNDYEGDIHKLAEVAWRCHQEGRKSPVAKKAGTEFADPAFELGEDWLAARADIIEAQKRHDDPNAPTRVLIVSGSDRNDQTCPGEISKTRRLCELAQTTLEKECSIQTEVLDLSQVNSQYGKTIHPCKGCVSTAMPLCHWPCSCYPNYALGQVNDWMAEIYPKWVAAHAVLIVSAVYWYQAPSALKLMIDRLVCADGGNPDPTKTHGKTVSEAKQLELAGWDYPRHLAGRLFSVIVHGDAAGVEFLKSALCNWLTDIGLIPSPTQAALGRYIGYYQPYATSHVALDMDTDLQKEVRNSAWALATAVHAARGGRLAIPHVQDPRPK
jgi:multimeric flavodoxin WrbA